MNNNKLDFKLKFIDYNTKISLDIYINNNKIWYLYLSIGEGYLWIDIFNISPKYQKQGYGKQVIQYLSNYYTIKGESTESARFFWEKVGWKFTSLSDFVIWARETRSQVDLRKWLKT